MLQTDWSVCIRLFGLLQEDMPRDGSATRQRILDAAERLVIENGYSSTSVDQVIAASETSKGAFFHHSDSKLALAARSWSATPRLTSLTSTAQSRRSPRRPETPSSGWCNSCECSRNPPTS